MSGARFNLPAFAKINLLLRVLGRRADGFHEIRTVLQTITLCDRLTFEPLADERIELVCDAPDIPADESNLVFKAAVALRNRFRTGRGARITLEKSIPAQGGLGGGSSDAAVALLALSRMWNLKTDADELAEIAATLGADVPFFLTGGTALGTGTGATITPLDDEEKQHLVIVVPGVGVATDEAYRALNAPALTKEEGVANLSVSRREPQFQGSFREAMRNDFEAVVTRLRPEIGPAKEALSRAGARREMLSGSGSAVFGVFDDKGAAERASVELKAEGDWRVFPCATLSRAEYREALGECAAILK
jgi:4-diphosphocytidyl-2-C-methyl-D-erythritol kinase